MKCAGILNRLFIGSVILVLLLPTVCCLLLAGYRWDFAQNQGLTISYYGEFNRVRYALAGMQNIRVTKSWHNPDITLEEFGFTLRRSDGREIHLTFMEDDPLRKFEGTRLETALRQRIRQQAAP